MVLITTNVYRVLSVYLLYEDIEELGNSRVYFVPKRCIFDGGYLGKTLPIVRVISGDISRVCSGLEALGISCGGSSLFPP